MEIPEGIRSIGSAAFADNYITAVNLPNFLESIGSEAFAGNDIHELSLPVGVRLGPRSFASNGFLSSVTIPDDARIYGGNPFCDCPELTSLKEVKVNLKTSQYIKNGGIGLVNSEGMLIMPLEDLPDENVQPVKSIGAYCYAYNWDVDAAGLNGLDLSSIDIYAFFWAINLTSVTFGRDNVKYIGTNAFNHCDIRTLDLPSSLTEINGRAFAFNENLSSVNIPANISSIDEGAFLSCTALKGVYMSGDYTVAPNIAENAFEGDPHYLIRLKDKATYDLFRASPQLSSLNMTYGQ